MDREEMDKKMGKVIAKAWADAEFKARLLANPAETLQAEGIETPAGVKLNVVENTNEQLYVVIPQAPHKLSDEDLDSVAGGFCACALCWWAPPTP